MTATRLRPGRTLPALSLRETRVRLLAWSYRDVFDTGTMDGGGADSASSRLLLHGELWSAGSYDELELAMAASPPSLRRAFWREHVCARHPFDSREADSVSFVSRVMPDSVWVPLEVSEAAGFLSSEAKPWLMPKREIVRRRSGWRR